MSPAPAAVVIALMSSLTVSSMGFFPFASAFVNIVSPSKGEAVPAGSSLTVSGTSVDTAQTNCNKFILDMTTNAGIVSDAMKFVTQKKEQIDTLQKIDERIEAME